MKKLLLLFVVLFRVFFASAQTADADFKADFGIGYAKPTEGFGVKPGVTFVAEPHYNLTRAFAIGVRFEGALLGYQADYDDELFSFFGSSCVTMEYYFAKGNFKPFLGAGAGLFTRHYILQSEYDDEFYTSGYGAIKLGFLGRIGFEAGHIRVTGTYNYVGNNFSYATLTVGYIVK